MYGSSCRGIATIRFATSLVRASIREGVSKAQCGEGCDGRTHTVIHSTKYILYYSIYYRVMISTVAAQVRVSLVCGGDVLV